MFVDLTQSYQYQLYYRNTDVSLLKLFSNSRTPAFSSLSSIITFTHTGSGGKAQINIFKDLILSIISDQTTTNAVSTTIFFSTTNTVSNNNFDFFAGRTSTGTSQHIDLVLPLRAGTTLYTFKDGSDSYNGNLEVFCLE